MPALQIRQPTKVAEQGKDNRFDRKRRVFIQIMGDDPDLDSIAAFANTANDVQLWAAHLVGSVGVVDCLAASGMLKAAISLTLANIEIAQRIIKVLAGIGQRINVVAERADHVTGKFTVGIVIHWKLRKAAACPPFARRPTPLSSVIQQRSAP